MSSSLPLCLSAGSLMFASPLLFDRVGWAGVASATPNFMLLAGLPFFAGCIAYTFMAGERAPSWR
jgi:AAA family ATP:ADP antiporter